MNNETAIGSESIGATPKLSPTYVVGTKVQHIKYGPVTVLEESATGIKIRYDVAPPELDGEIEDIVCAEDLQPAAQSVAATAAGHPSGTFKERAALGLKYNIPVIPLRGKRPFLSNWQNTASTEPAQIEEWNEQYSDANCGLVAKAGLDGFWCFEVDSPDVAKRYKTETGSDLPSNTLIVASRPGRGHRWFRHTIDSIKMGNIGQSDTIEGDFSVRANNEQAVAPGSIHPESQKPYRLINDVAPVEAPKQLIEWILKQKKSTSAKPRTLSLKGEPIPNGQHDSFLTQMAGKLRSLEMERDSIAEALIETCENRCENYGADYRQMCEKIAKSVCNYPPGEAVTLILGKKPSSSGSMSAVSSSRAMQFVSGNTCRPQRLKWLWRGRILADKLNVFSGEPDVGKGMTTIDLAARITRHLDFPDCKNELDGCKDVLFMSSEDDRDDTIVPRLIAAGADMSRVHFVEISENVSGTSQEGVVCLDRDLPALEAKIKENPDIVLIIPDPVIAFLGDADPNKDREVRPIYTKMKAFAKRSNVAWLFVNHWNKNQNATSINKTSGAKTMVSAPRATWMFAKSPGDPTRYLMMKGKGNLSASGPGGVKTLAYHITSVPFDFGDGRPMDPDGVPKLVWDGTTEDTCDDVLQEASDPNKRSKKAEELLTDLLAEQAKLATDIYREGDKANVSADKLKRARYALSYLAEKIDGRWYWAKSDDDMQALKVRLFSPARLLTAGAEAA